MQIGPRDKKTAEKLFYKLPEPLKKKPSTILTSSVCTMKLFPQNNTIQWGKRQAKRAILKDLIAPLDNGAQDL